MSSKVLKQLKEKNVTPLDLIFHCRLDAEVVKLIMRDGGPLDWVTAQYLRNERGIDV